MLIIRKEESKLVLIQNNKEYQRMIIHLILGFMIISGILPPTYILIEAPLTLFIFALLIFSIIKLKIRKITKKIIICLEKDKLVITKKKDNFIFLEKIVNIDIKEYGYYVVEIKLNNKIKNYIL